MEYIIILFVGFAGGIAVREYWLEYQPWYQNIVAAFKKKA